MNNPSRRTMNTTVKTRSPLISQPTEVQNAYNALAIAIKNHTSNPNDETLKAREDALQEAYRVEDLYRDGRKRLLNFEREQMLLQSGRRS